MVVGCLSGSFGGIRVFTPTLLSACKHEGDGRLWESRPNSMKSASAVDSPLKESPMKKFLAISLALVALAVLSAPAQAGFFFRARTAFFVPSIVVSPAVVQTQVFAP